MASYNPGTYEGAGRGYGGKLIVNVTVSENRIESVKVTQHKEYRGIAWGLNTTPIERYPKLIVEYQTLNIPTVDGADLTCAAILDATAAALKAAGASKEDIAALKAAPAPKAPEYQDEVRTVDVVVCGAGAGGLAAAIEAKLAGAEVVIVEKQGITGGATARSGGKLLGAGTKWQKKQGLYDNTDMVYDYLMDVGNRNGKFMDASKNRYLVDHLNQTLDWLTSIEATVKGDPAEVLAQPWEPLSKPVEKDGVLKTHFDVLDVEPIHVSLQPWRVHNSPGGGGQTNGEGGEISTPLTLYYENDLGGEIIYDTAMNEILTDEAGVVTGVTCTRKGGAKLTLYARKGVILATGGYALICIVFFILYICFPILSPACQDLALFGNPKKLLEQAEDELATLPQLATEDMFITEHFFIETSVYGNAIVPIDEIIWIYKYSTLHKFFWYHFSISYTLHISANRHLYIQCPKNIKSDIDGIIDYLAEANHKILVGFSEANRLKVQEIQGTPMHFEKFIAFLKKRV